MIQKVEELELFSGKPEPIPQTLIHDLAQPLTTVSFYMWSCVHEITNGDQDIKSILHAMDKALQDIEYAQQIITHIQDYLLGQK